MKLSTLLLFFLISLMAVFGVSAINLKRAPLGVSLDFSSQNINRWPRWYYEGVYQDEEKSLTGQMFSWDSSRTVSQVLEAHRLANGANRDIPQAIRLWTELFWRANPEDMYQYVDEYVLLLKSSKDYQLYRKYWDYPYYREDLGAWPPEIFERIARGLDIPISWPDKNL